MTKHPLLYLLTPLFLIPIAIIWYSYFWNAIPFYSHWDSSLLYANDILAVSSGLTPDHMFHPNMFPLVLYRWIIIPLGEFFGLISISTISELQSSLNPHLAHTEFIIYIFNVCRTITFLFCSMLYINLIKLLKPSIDFFSNTLQLLSYMGLTIISYIIPTMMGLHQVIRYESFGLLFMMLSIFYIIKATENGDHKKERFYIVLSGFWAGAAFLSKILFLGGGILIPFIYFSLKKKPYTLYSRTDYKHSFIGISIVTALIFTVNIILLVAFLRDTLEITAFYFRGMIYIIFFVALFIGFLGLLMILNLYLWKGKKELPDFLKITVHPLTLYTIGVISPLFTALTIGNKFNALLHSFIFSFGLGQIIMGINSGYNRPFPSIPLNAIGISTLLIGVLTIIIVLRFCYLRLYKKSQYRHLFFGIITVLTTFILNKILLRNGGDTIIGISLMSITCIILYREFLSVTKHKKYIIALGLCVLYGISYSRISSMLSITKSQRYNTVTYNYNTPAWRTSTYGLRTKVISDLMRDRYPTERSWYQALSWSKNILPTKRLLQQVQNGENTLRDSILAYKNAYLDLNKKNQITKIHSILEGGLLLPIVNDSQVYYRSDYDFYLLSDSPYPVTEDIQEKDIDFTIDKKKYYVYQLYQSDLYSFDTLSKGGAFDSSMINIASSNNVSMYIAIVDKFK